MCKTKTLLLILCFWSGLAHAFSFPGNISWYSEFAEKSWQSHTSDPTGFHQDAGYEDGEVNSGEDWKLFTNISDPRYCVVSFRIARTADIINFRYGQLQKELAKGIELVLTGENVPYNAEYDIVPRVSFSSSNARATRAVRSVASASYPQIFDALTDGRQEEGDSYCSILAIIGHSLSGAVAQMTAFYFLNDSRNENMITLKKVVSLNSPRFANKDFYDMFEVNFLTAGTPSQNSLKVGSADWLVYCRSKDPVKSLPRTFTTQLYRLNTQSFIDNHRGCSSVANSSSSAARGFDNHGIHLWSLHIM